MAASSSSGPPTCPLTRRPEEFGYLNPAKLRNMVQATEERLIHDSFGSLIATARGSDALE